VQDLSGNSKISETSDPGANDVFTFRTAPGDPNTAADPLVENFDDQTRVDTSVTSAKWGTAIPGFLTGGVGGGTGKTASSTRTTRGSRRLRPPTSP
jgi:hypothetical protein